MHIYMTVLGAWPRLVTSQPRRFAISRPGGLHIPGMVEGLTTLAGRLIQISLIALLVTGFSSHARDANHHYLPNPNCGLALSADPTHIIIDTDEAKLQAFARRHRLVIELLAPNPASLTYSVRPGYHSKTTDLKDCKSATRGPNVGLVQCPPELFNDQNVWQTVRAKLALSGYFVLGADHHYLVVNAKGEMYYSDYDLLGLYDEFGRPVYSEAIRTELNSILGREMFRHGPLADYHARELIGLKLPVRVLAFGNTPHTIFTLDTLRQYEAQLKIQWAWKD